MEVDRMIKSRNVILVLFIVLLMFSACSKNKVNDKPLILTSIYPYELIVKQIVKDKAQVQSLIPANTSPHTYSPLPGDIKLISEAECVFSNGLELEVSFEKIFADLKEKHIEVTHYIPKAVIEFEHQNQLHHKEDSEHAEEPHQEEPHSAEHHHHDGINPHIWLHPENIIDIAKGITGKMTELMPENKAFFEQNLEELINDVMKADRLIISDREKVRNVNLIGFHDSFHYFNLRYNIKSFGFIQKFPGKEPTVQELDQIAKVIKDNQIKIIVTEPQLNPKPVKILSEEFKLKVVELDPLGQTLAVSKISELLLDNWKNLNDGNQ